METITKMDFSLQSPEERTEKVKEIIANTPPERLTPAYLEKLADYIIFAMDKKEKKEKKILTNNHMKTVNDRETSFEGLVNKLENGEDGIYNLIAQDKNIIFKPKISITEEDLTNIPELRQLKEAIAAVEKELKTARGSRAFNLKKQLIQMRQNQYIIKNAYCKPIYCMKLIKNIPKIDLSEEAWVDAEGHIQDTALIHFYDPQMISTLLCSYSRIKEDCWDKLDNDARWMMEDLDNLIDAALLNRHPLYYDLLIYKIDGRSNAEIQELLYNKYGIKHSIEYISSLWRNKIPRLICTEAQNQFLEWYYTFVEKGSWKRCGRCGQIKLSHKNFFSKNKTSTDGFYSICKCCRNGKEEEED